MKAMDALLQEALTRGQTAWSGLAVEPALLSRYLAERLGADEDPAVLQPHLSDLYLACACSHSVPGALAAFEQAVLVPVARVLRSYLTEAAAEDALQDLRERLLVGRDGKLPELLGYGGRGPLRGWVRINAVWYAHKRLRARDAADRGVEDQRLLDQLLHAPAGAEKAYVAQQYKAALEQACQATLAALSVEQRAMLRWHYLDGLTVEAIGALMGLHKANVSRRLKALRQEIRQQVYQRLAQGLQLAPEDLDSLVRTLQSQVDLSLSRLLR